MAENTPQKTVPHFPQYEFLTLLMKSTSELCKNFTRFITQSRDFVLNSGNETQKCNFTPYLLLKIQLANNETRTLSSEVEITPTYLFWKVNSADATLSEMM